MAMPKLLFFSAPESLLSPTINDLRCCQCIDQLEGLVTSSPSSLHDSSKTTVCSLGAPLYSWTPLTCMSIPMRDGLLPKLAIEPKSRVHCQAPSFPTCQVPFSLHHAAARSWLYAIIIKRHGLAPATFAFPGATFCFMCGFPFFRAAISGKEKASARVGNFQLKERS